MKNRHDQIIAEFVIQLVNNTTFYLGNNFMVYLSGVPSDQINLAFQKPLQTPIGQTLDDIARAARREITDDPGGDNRGVIREGIQGLMEQLFSPPGLGAAYTIPDSFWETDLGGIVAQALVWSEKDELITQAEAGRLANVSVKAINSAIRDGRLRGYRLDDSQPHRPGGQLVSRAAVTRLWDIIP